MSSFNVDEQRLEGELVEQWRGIKKTLKQLSKNQLIQMCVELSNAVTEQQNINQHLLSELKSYRPEEPENENSTSPID